MSQYVTKIRTSSGDLQIDYSSLANLPAYNFLDNSNFKNPVNQRDKKSYSSAGYTIDRWKISSGSTVTVNNGSVTVSGSMVQYIDGLENSTYTFAYGNGNRIEIGSVSYDNTKSCYYVSVPDGTWTWAALYEGVYTAEFMPPYIPKGYGSEIAECMRYYQTYYMVHFNPNYQYFVGDVLYTHFNTLLLPVPMRTSPNVIINVASLTDVGEITSQTTMETSSKCVTPVVQYSGTVAIKTSCAIHFDLSADL